MFNNTKDRNNRARFCMVALVGIALCGTAQRGHAQQNAFPAREFQMLDDAFDTIVADINQDGILDIVSANGSTNKPNTVAVSTGNGDGTFNAPVVVDTDWDAQAIVVADVNHDGTPDIIVAHKFPMYTAEHPNDYITVLLNAADGNGPLSFYAPIIISMNGIAALAVADVDGDGNPDIVFSTANPNQVGILYGDGAGNFNTRFTMNLGFEPGNLAVADLNGDGKADLIVNDTTNYRIQVLLNGGGNHLTLGATYPVAPFTTDVVLADLNGDGKLDLITEKNVTQSNGGSQGSVLIYHGNGNGTFNPTPTAYTVPESITRVNVTDANGDGKPDLLVIPPAIGKVLVLTNQGNFQFATQSYVSGTYTYQAHIADVTGDGKPDLLTFELYGKTFAVLTGNGDGTFNSQPEAAPSGSDIGSALGDVNNDGIPDLVYFNRNDYTLNICLGKGDATFAPPIVYSFDHEVDSLALADVDGDGNLDIILTEETGAGTTSDNVGVMHGYGNGGFNLPVYRLYTPLVFLAAVGDINRDGKPDLVLTDYNNTITVIFGNGTVNFGNSVTFQTGDSNLDVTLVDFNDGTYKYIATTDYDNKLLHLFAYDPFNPVAPFVPSAQYSTGFQALGINMVDINGDGKPDLVYANSASRNIAVRLGGAGHTFGPETLVATGVYVDALRLSDIDGDGKPDLVYSADERGSLNIQYNLGGGNFGPVQQYAGNVSARTLLLADLDGDGWTDIVSLGIGPIDVFHHIGYGTHSVSGNLTLEGIASNGVAQDIALTFTPTNGGTPVIRHTLVKPDGNYTVTNIPKGNYFVRIKGVKYLAVDKAVNLTTADATGFDALLHVGDADDSNTVDISDFGYLVDSYGTSINDGLNDYDARVDFNGDGTIDIADFALLVANYGTVGDP